MLFRSICVVTICLFVVQSELKRVVPVAIMTVIVLKCMHLYTVYSYSEALVPSSEVL